MKKKTIAGLIAIVVIASVAIFASVKEETPISTPTPTPTATLPPMVTPTPTPPAEQEPISSIGDVLKNADKYMGKEVTIEGIVTQRGVHVRNVYVGGSEYSEIRTVKEIPFIEIKDSTGEIRVEFDSDQPYIFVSNFGHGSKIRVVGKVNEIDGEEILIKGISWEEIR